MRCIIEEIRISLRKLRERIRLVQQRSVTAEEGEATVVCKRVEGKDLRNTAGRYAAEKDSHAVFQISAGIVAVP